MHVNVNDADTFGLHGKIKNRKYAQNVKVPTGTHQKKQ